MLLLLFQHPGERSFCGAGGVAAAIDFFIGGTGVRRMVEDEENKIDCVWKRIELTSQPISLRTGKFVERAIKNQHEAIADADGIEAVVGKLWEAREIVWQRDVGIALEIVVSEDRVDGNIVITPDFSFSVIDGPIVGAVSGVDNVSFDGDERRMFLIDRGDKGLAHGGVSGLCFGRIVEASVTEGDKAKVGGDFQPQGYRIPGRDGDRLLVDAPPVEAGHSDEEKCEEREIALGEHGGNRVTREGGRRVNRN